MADLTFVHGRKGKRSKAEVRLSCSTVFQCPQMCVWEGGVITHSFHPDTKFCRALIEMAQEYLDYQERLMQMEQERKNREKAQIQGGV